MPSFFQTGYAPRREKNVTLPVCQTLFFYLVGTVRRNNQKTWSERPQEHSTVCDIQCLRHHMCLTYCEKTQGFLVCIMLIVDMQMSKNVELRAPNGWFCSSSLFFAMYLHLCSKLSSLAIFFFTFHLGGACTTFRGWWTRVLHWGDATVHARGISRELALWSSLWKSLSIGSAHFSLHGATAYPTAACPLCELDLFCAWTLHGSVWPQPNPNPTPYPA